MQESTLWRYQYCVPPEKIDVNIHPSKSEVRFRNEHAVFAAVQKSVRRALIGQAPCYIDKVAVNYASPQTTAQLWQAMTESHRAVSALPEALSTPMASLPMLRVWVSL